MLYRFLVGTFFTISGFCLAISIISYQMNNNSKGTSALYLFALLLFSAIWIMSHELKEKE